jgi:hypothetical protein
VASWAYAPRAGDDPAAMATPLAPAILTRSRRLMDMMLSLDEETDPRIEWMCGCRLHEAFPCRAIIT